MQQNFMLIRFAGAYALVPVEKYDDETNTFTPDVKAPFVSVGYNGELNPGQPYQHSEFGLIYVSPLDIMDKPMCDKLMSIAEGNYAENGVAEPIPAPEVDDGSDSSEAH